MSACLPDGSRDTWRQYQLLDWSYYRQEAFVREDSLLFNRSYLERTEKFYDKYGPKTAIIARLFHRSNVCSFRRGIRANEIPALFCSQCNRRNL